MLRTSNGRFQFTIRGLMLTTAVIAFACPVGCLKTAKLEDALFAFATGWIVVGLVVQMADLWAAFRQTSGLTRDQTCGWWFAILSRAALVLLVAGHFVVMELLATGRLALAGRRDIPWLGPWEGFLGPLGNESLRNAIFALSLLLVFAGLDGGRTPRPRRRWTAAINLLTTLAVAVLVYRLLIDRFLVYGLVHIACEGIALGMPHGHAAYARVYTDARSLSFLGRALLAGGLLLLDFFLLRLLISFWNRGKLLRAVAIAGLCISLPLTAIHPVWVATRGLKDMSPFFVEVYQFGPINRWVFGMVLAVVLAAAGARRLFSPAQAPSRGPHADWRRRPAGYYHEYRLLSLFVAVTIVGTAIRALIEAQRTLPAPRIFPQPLGWAVWQSAQYAIEAGLADPCCQLWLAVFCLAVYRAIFGFARKSESLGSPPRELPLMLYALVWTALLAIVVMAAPIIAALGFGLCLNWWRLPF